MAAKKQRGSYKDPFTSEGKPYFFDVGIADEMAVCYSCHAGGGVAEGVVNEDGSVTPYDSDSLSPVHTYDRDFYSYDSNDLAYALNSGKSIEETINDIGAPKKFDWKKSGVMENDCLLCHTDPDYNSNAYTYKAADGLYVQPFRPRLMIFAQRDSNGNVTKISLGMPLTNGILNQSALNYTNDIMRMTRPIGSQFFMLGQLPKDDIGELFKIWTDGLKNIVQNGGTLPYGLYAPPEIVSDIYNGNNINDNYTYNPNGGSDEMQKLMANQQNIGAIFTEILTYMKNKGYMPDNATMDDLNKMFFNEFVYGYEILDPGTGQLLPIPYPLRKYDKGKFYTDWDDPNASVRDYVRDPLIEGEGINYSGMVGLGWASFMYAYGKIMQGDNTYADPNGFFGINLSKVVADIDTGKISYDLIKSMSTKHDYLTPFFNMMPVAELMGLDINHDGAPLSYVQIVKDNNSWHAVAYYNKSDFDNGTIPGDMIFGSHNDTNSWKWIKICGQCHVMTQDHGNSEWTRGRLYNLGMPADWVKNGQFVNFTNDEEASGYDVHMSSKKLSCGSCHLKTTGNTLEDMHNFLKGTDTAHMVRNDIDNSPPPKTCEYCHIAGGDPNAPNPTEAHEKKFGENTERHIAEIACKTCHIPYRRTWRFRTFDDTLGYYSNFDNRFGYYIFTGQLGNFPAMAFPPYYALSPVYGTSPGYGIPHFHMVSQHIDADGKGVQPMDYVSQMVDYFWFNSSADPGKLVNGLMTNPKFDFWKKFLQISFDRDKSLGVPLDYDKNHDNEVYPPLYWANGHNGYPQIVIGNPVTILTWVDANPEPDADMSDLPYNGAKVLYLKEINAAIDKYLPVANFYAYTPAELKDIPANGCKDDPNIGKVILKDSGYAICDHTGDGFPDLWWPEDVEAMQTALVKVLKAEGETDPKPMLFVAAHYFSDSHGVQPKEKALGAKSCYDCHGDYKKNPGAHRITDRIITFIPWVPAWFKDEYRALKYDEKTGEMVASNSSKPLFIVDGEVAYIKPISANNLTVLGAEAKDVLALSKHHAEELYYMINTTKSFSVDDISSNINVSSDDLKKLGLDGKFYKPVLKTPDGKLIPVFVPEDLAKKITGLGILPGKQKLITSDGKEVEGYVVKVESEENSFAKPVIVSIPYTEPGTPVILRKPVGVSTSSTVPDGYSQDSSAQVIDSSNGYVTIAVSKPGEYSAVSTASLSAAPTTVNSAYSSGGGGGGCSISENAKFDPTLLILALILYALHIKFRKKHN